VYKGQVSRSCLRIGWSGWSVELVLPVPRVQAFWSIVLTELDSCRPIPENTDQIYFRNMMDDYGEALAVALAIRSSSTGAAATATTVAGVTLTLTVWMSTSGTY
jgi:hypothetical protein